jgi:glutamine synthetase
MRDPIKMVVYYKDGKEKAHQSVPESNLANHLKMYEESGYTCEVMTEEEYWKKFHSGELEVGTK